LNPNTTIHEIISAYPGLIEDLPAAYPRFAPLRNPAARAVMAKVATIERAAGIAGVSVQKLLSDIADMIERRTGDRVAPAGASDDSGRAERVADLKRIIEGLHAGGSVEDARREFQDAVGAASAEEIAAMEQELIRDGMPVQEIQRLCDLHVQVVRFGLDQQPLVAPPSGHPVHTYMAENREIERRANAWAEVCRRAGESDPPSAEALNIALDALAGVDTHYTRKEHQLFPALEAKGFTGPSRVMWGVHDQIRARVKAVREAVVMADATRIAEDGLELARQITEMIYKEERILFPTAMSLLSEDDWVRMRKGDSAIGHLIEPGSDWPPAPAQPEPIATSTEAAVNLSTGVLTHEQLDRILVHLPVEISFVDEHDIVRFYSDHTDRIFPRSPGDIGRAVQNCHPQSSLHMVEAILTALRSGERDSARFWINFRGRMIMIGYHAVRSEDGRYLGCMEVTQDITDIKALEGERRLLDWS
ncbi:MAG: DUF438 domain-containing protein, partial [Armatimonadetes bacterium]|nr:DUF438 domain-containing protein [Armatimonadota bacterium]